MVNCGSTAIQGELGRGGKVGGQHSGVEGGGDRANKLPPIVQILVYFGINGNILIIQTLLLCLEPFTDEDS